MGSIRNYHCRVRWNRTAAAVRKIYPMQPSNDHEEDQTLLAIDILTDAAHALGRDALERIITRARANHDEESR